MKHNVLKSMRLASGESLRVICKAIGIKAAATLLDFEKGKECYKRFLRAWLYLSDKKGLTDEELVKKMRVYSGKKTS